MWASVAEVGTARETQLFHKPEDREEFSPLVSEGRTGEKCLSW